MTEEVKNPEETKETQEKKKAKPFNLATFETDAIAGVLDGEW